MKLWDCFATALKTLLSHKMRSILTMLGILIGVAAVISMVSLVRAEQAMVQQSFESLGTNLIFVTPGAGSSGMGIGGVLGSTATLTLEDAEAIARDAPSVSMVAPVTQTTTQIVAGEENVGCLTIGVTPEYQYVRNFEPEQGIFITEQDCKGRARVVVLGSQLAETLFGQMSPVGQSVRIDGRQFRVIGVLKSKGEAFGVEDQSAMVPLTTAQAVISSERAGSGGHTIQAISVQAQSREAIDSAQWEISNILRQRHRIIEGEDDDFTVMSMDALLGVADQMYGIGELVMGAIAGISLLVGGIGIMNIMLATVMERTREIGIKRAIGARKNDILTQFLTEAMIISITGGLIGVLIGLTISFSISLVTDVKTDVTIYSVFISFFVSIIVGIISGFLPAKKAAELKPIEALRYE